MNWMRELRVNPARLRQEAVLLLALVCGVVTLAWSSFSDESDNLVVGRLLLQGNLLYGDIFSHHFPFPYYWAAAVEAVVGNSIWWVRLSVWLFQLGAIWIAGVASGYARPAFLAAVLWSVLRVFYDGHMLLYPAFAAPALLVVFAVTLAILTGQVQPTRRHALLVGLFSLVAFLSDPLTSYAIGMATIFLLIRAPRTGLLAGLIGGAGLCLVAGYYALTSSLDDFVAQAVWFNTEIYGKYAGTDPVRFHLLLRKLYNGLGIIDPIWRTFAPMREICTFDSCEFDYWMFTGFLYRLTLLVMALFLLLSRRYLASLFTILFAAAVLNLQPGFRGTAFVLLSLFAIGFVSFHPPTPAGHRPWVRYAVLVPRLIVVLMATWLMVRVTGHVVLQREHLSYQANFGWMEDEAERMKKLSCYRQDVRLGYYPGNPYVYWFSDMQPVARYVYLWPWVADFGLPEIIDALDDQPAIVRVEDTVIWGHYPTRDYLAPLLAYLDENYQKVDNDLYIAPELMDCQDEGAAPRT